MANINVLHIQPEIVCDLVERAREFQAKEGVTFPEDNLNSEYEYDWAQILADHQDDLTYHEIKSVIHSLSEDQQTDLLALLYLGRGDFTEWEEAREAAVTNLPANLTDYLLAHPLFPDFLTRALGFLNYSCEE